MNISNLPNEISFSIFDLLDQKSLKNFSEVCKVFRELAGVYNADRKINRALSYLIQSNPDIDIFEFFENTKKYGKEEKQIESYKNLEVKGIIHILDLSNILRGNSELLTIDIQNIKFTEELDKEDVANLLNQDVNEINLEEIQGEEIFELKHRQELMELIFSFNHLQKLEKLKLRFDNVKIFNDAALQTIIDRCPNLTELSIIGSSITDDGLINLLELFNLKKLTLRDSHLLFLNKKALGKCCPKMSYVDLSNNEFLDRNIVSFLNFFPNLTTLILDESGKQGDWSSLEFSGTFNLLNLGNNFNDLSITNTIKTLSVRNLSLLDISSFIIPQFENIETLNVSTLFLPINSKLNDYKKNILKLANDLKVYSKLKSVGLEIINNLQFKTLSVLNCLPKIKNLKISNNNVLFLDNSGLKKINNLIYVKNLSLNSLIIDKQYYLDNINYSIESIELHNCINTSCFPFPIFKNLRKIVIHEEESAFSLEQLLNLKELKFLNQLIFISENTLQQKVLTGNEIHDYIETSFVNSFLNLENQPVASSLLTKRNLEFSERDSKRRKF